MRIFLVPIQLSPSSNRLAHYYVCNNTIKLGLFAYFASILAKANTQEQ
jgi:hypothetical protein